MSRRPRAAFAVLVVVGLLAGCQSFAPQQDPSPSLDYDPVAVTVTGPEQLAVNETGTVTVRTRLKASRPEYVRPNATVTGLSNVSVALAPAALVTGERVRSTDRLRAGETVTWRFSVCGATPAERGVTATVDGTALSGESPVGVPDGWERSTGQTMLAIGDTATNSTTATSTQTTVLRGCTNGGE